MPEQVTEKQKEDYEEQVGSVRHNISDTTSDIGHAIGQYIARKLAKFEESYEERLRKP
jgi:hypothetical protein